jgi:hypothetical protein
MFRKRPNVRFVAERRFSHRRILGRERNGSFSPQNLPVGFWTIRLQGRPLEWLDLVGSRVAGYRRHGMEKVTWCCVPAVADFGT